MITYTFLCQKCDNQFEVEGKISEETFAVCPICNSSTNSGLVKKIIVKAPRFTLKGSGWAADNYSKNSIGGK